jgi:hypothetical protein
MYYHRIIPILIGLLLMLTGSSATYAAPIVGPVTPANSITGTASGDQIGSGGVYILPGGNIVIVSEFWNGGRGAVTCLTPTDYRAGNIIVDETNSLTGEHINSRVGSGGITVLATGNYVVSSPNWGSDLAGTSKRGAATWVNGKNCRPFGTTTRNALVSPVNSLVGDVGDVVDTNQVSSGGVVGLTNGHYVVVSPKYNGDAGAVTWGSGQKGLAGLVSSSNSLMGTNPNHKVASKGVIALTNGNYVVVSPLWDSDIATDIGAVTWGDGKTGTTIGSVSATNSLVGVSNSDQIGNQGVIALANGNYVVQSTSWDNGATVNVGAVTWGDGKVGTKGTVKVTNSIIGLGASDALGGRVTPLTSGHYLVIDDDWNGVGAVRWVNGEVVSVGKITTSNALYGSAGADTIGQEVVALPNGNYVVISPFWNDGVTNNAGAVTWGNGNGGIIGTVNATNSLIGGQQDDRIGSNGIVILSNGNYVVRSELWHTDITSQLGAVTWCPGKSVCAGVVTSANSLVGTTSGDRVGGGTGGNVHALKNGHYVVISPAWSAQGAVTWGDGTIGLSGEVNGSNSLLGSGNIHHFLALTNGNYVFASTGAATFATGNAPLTGSISASNSLLDAAIVSGMGNVWLTALPNGNYVVSIANWTNTSPDAAGAIIWGDGINGTVGAISPANILAGDIPGHQVGSYPDMNTPPVIALPDSDYIVKTTSWDNDIEINVGAITRALSNGSTVGFIAPSNSLVGSTVSDNVGSRGITLLPDGGFLVISPDWNGVGAVTYIEGNTNLLLNGGFEQAGTTAALAKSWIGQKLLINDKRLCSTTNKALVTPEGKCAFQFKAGNNNQIMRGLKQAIKNPVWGFAGDQLTIRTEVEGLNVRAGVKVVLVNVKYIDNTTSKLTLTIPENSYAYQTISQTLTLTQRVKTVTVTLKPGKVGGQIRFDNVFLSISPAPVLRFPALGEAATRDGANPFGLPDTPDGFRK